jgi:L-seryl-tRNA(Ser) seleniumtransferase
MSRKVATEAGLRGLPSVDAVLRLPEAERLVRVWGRAAVVKVVRSALQETRQQLRGGGSQALTAGNMLQISARLLEATSQPSLAEAINATGVIVHTGLGRSLLADEAIAALQRAAASACVLEMDATSGQRENRDRHVRGLLCELTGAQAATVVNNNAAAVSLAVNTLAQGREVIVSRGQLIEIGGEFRLPDVIARSGAILVEVGTTNRTRANDYASAISPDTGMLLWVHASNYRIVGFAEEPDVGELVGVGRERGVPVMADLGSGALVDVSERGLEREPTAQWAVACGADVITFSGDKLLGGPQAGIILGTEDVVARIRKNPLARTVRVDKFTLAALEATLRLYRDPDSAWRKVPTLNMIARPAAEIRKAALSVARAVKSPLAGVAKVSVEAGHSQVGGGALPGQNIPTGLVALEPLSGSAQELAARLRRCEPAVVGRIHADRVLLDMRTVPAHQMGALKRALESLAGPPAEPG